MRGKRDWDETARVTFDRALLHELATPRFLDAHHHVTLVGPVGVGKTFLAHALGHVACRRGHSVLALRADRMLKTLKQARLTQRYETALRRLLAVDLLVVDDFGLDAMDAQESRNAYDLVMEGESYRAPLAPTRRAGQPPGTGEKYRLSRQGDQGAAV